MMGAVLAIDPGRDKCGIAVLTAEGTVLYQEVIPAERLVDAAMRLVAAHDPTIIMGSGTTSAAAKRRIEEAGGGDVVLVDEYRTTDEARRAYWKKYPPRGWRRFVPRGMLLPPEPVDDFAAVILAQRFLAARACHSSN